MFMHTLEAGIASARSLAHLNELSTTLWKAFASGMLEDADAGRLSEQLEAQRRIIRPRDTVAVRAPAVPRTRSIFPPKRPAPVSPDRAASMARRRRLAASGPMPPALAAGFTTGELAALRIVADEVRTRGVCGLFLGAIAARAGVSVSTARNALRQAARAGLITIEERRREGRKNDSNLVRVISREWLTWLARGPEPIGFKNLKPTDKGSYSSVRTAPFPEVLGLAKGRKGKAEASRGLGRGGSPLLGEVGPEPAKA